MKRKLALLLALMMATVALFSGCDKKEASTENGERMTITIGYPNADETWTEDEYFKYITDKLNIDIKFQTLSATSATEKARIWISSGDMPDVVQQSAFQLDEYKKYANQGLVRELPKDWEEKYPNLGFAMNMTGIMDYMKEQNDGELFALVRPMDHYSSWIEDFRTAYGEGKNLREMMNSPEYKYIDDYGFAYRKDWAEKLGIETDYIMEYEDFLEMARKFKEADLGGVGATNTVGITADYTEVPNFFVTAYNSSYKYFHKDETGKYVCGLLEDSTAEGIKAYAEAYRTGILAKDFYTQKSADLNSIFCSQRSGIIFPRSGLFYLRTLKADFEKANPGMNAEDAIGICWVLSPDGKIHGREAGNFFGAYYFNPELSDEKMEKILELADYISSPEGGPQVRLGVPGVDYKVENGEYIVTREANDDGVLETLDKKYPSYEFFRNFLNPMWNNSVDPDPVAAEEVRNFKKAKLEHELSLLDWDEARDCYTADDYVKFNASYEVNGLFAEIVVGEGDIEKNWEKKKKEFEKDANSVAKNMNEALLK